MKHRILFVDELFNGRYVLAETLQECYPSLEIVTAVNIDEAFVHLQEGPPFDLVIVDTHLLYGSHREVLDPHHEDTDESVSGLNLLLALREGKLFPKQPTDMPLILTSTTPHFLLKSYYPGPLQCAHLAALFIKPHSTFDLERQICHILNIPYLWEGKLST